MVIFLAGVFAMAAVIGIAVCISILTFGQKADVAAWSLSGLILLVSGIYYPVEVLPPVLQAMARAIPLTYFLEYYRSIFIPGPHHLATGAFLAALLPGPGADPLRSRHREGEKDRHHAAAVGIALL